MFIVLEGLDGAGKSTQIKMLQEWLNGQGVESEFVHFPRFDAPVYGDLIARYLRGELGGLEQVNPYLVALLYAGDRQAAAELIRGWIASDKVVIADRYVYSNIGYQCAKVPQDERNALKEWILDVEYNQFNIPQPDVTLFLDVPFSFTTSRLTEQREGDDRSYLNGSNDIHEASLDLQRSVREVYLDGCASVENFHRVDCGDSEGAMAPSDQIFTKILTTLQPYL